MSVSSPFIHRPIATSLVGVAVMLGARLGIRTVRIHEHGNCRVGLRSVHTRKSHEEAALPGWAVRYEGSNADDRDGRKWQASVVSGKRRDLFEPAGEKEAESNAGAKKDRAQPE
jgi:hypothetical protein